MNRSLKEVGNLLCISIGVLSAGMGLKGFLLSSNFIDGGVTGISMLLAKSSRLPLALCLPLVNLPFIVLAYTQMGLGFAARSVFAIAALALSLTFIPFPDVTADLVLTAVFGGFFIGAGIGLAVRGGAVLDGTEIAALVISRRSALLRVGDVILGFNVVLFLVAMSLLGIDAALYSILTYFAAAKTLDFVLYGIDEYTAITVISDEHEAIRNRITRELGRGVTIYKGFGGMSGDEKRILYCVITRLELGKIRSLVRELDHNAFLAFHPLSGAEGNTIRKGIGH